VTETTPQAAAGMTDTFAAGSGRHDTGAVSTPTAYGLLMMVVLLWGVNWPIMKVGIGYVPAFWFSFSRVFLGALTLFAIVAIRGQLQWPERRDMKLIMIVGLVQMGLFLALVHFALYFVAAGRGAILAYTTPLWVVPAAVIFLKERISWLSGVGLFAGVAGVAVLFNPFVFDWSDFNTVAGNGLLLLAAGCWAVGIIAVRRHEWKAGPLQLAPFACIPTAGLALIFEDITTARINWEAVIIIIYNGPITMVAGFLGLITITRALPAISTSLAVLAVPALGLLSSVIWTDEQVTWSLSAGLLLIVGGVALMALSDWRMNRT
jgi:drug/metabolite transporter (DMT)-like permease